MSCSLKDSKDMLEEFGIISNFHEIINKNALQEFEENLFDSIGDDAIASAMGNPFFIERFPDKSKIVFNKDFFRILDNVNDAKVFRNKVLNERISEPGVPDGVTQNAEELVPGAFEAFENLPELANIGTAVDYAEHLSTIFPGSQINQVLYHGTVSSGAREQGFQQGVTFLTKSQETAGGYVNQKVQAHEQNVMEMEDRGEEQSFDDYSPEVLNVIANIQNPFVEEQEKTYQENHETIDALLEQGTHDSFVSDVVNDSYGTESQIAVFDNTQIHRLGSEQDITMFSEYMSSKAKEQTAESIASQDRVEKLDAIYEYIDSMIQTNEVNITCKI